MNLVTPGSHVGEAGSHANELVIRQADTEHWLALGPDGQSKVVDSIRQHHPSLHISDYDHLSEAKTPGAVVDTVTAVGVAPDTGKVALSGL